MRNFAYSKAETAENAIVTLTQTQNSKFLGGGTNLVDLMRENITQPEAVGRRPLQNPSVAADQRRNHWHAILLPRRGGSARPP